jgi:hypothetical protein
MAYPEKSCPVPIEHFGHCWYDASGSNLFWCNGISELTPQDNDPVNHPAHYTSHPSGVECIEITRHMNFNLGNVVKYIWRAGMKDSAPTIQDLEKALWYLQDEINLRKKENND